MEMFCPKCGASEQSVETYCRKCGVFLPDFDKLAGKETPVEQNLIINSVFSGMTAVVSLSLEVALYFIFIGREGTPWILYAVFGFLVSITVWQIQTTIRTRLIKKQVERMKPKRSENVESLKPADTSNLLNEADFENVVPASVTDRTTRDLTPTSPQAKQ